jgi:hypothetical protein
MKTGGLVGFLDLLYESPNNWENRIKKPVAIYILWSDGSVWNTKKLTEMNHGGYFRISTSEIDQEIMRNNLAIVYPTFEKLEPQLSILPSKKIWFSEIPSWRNTSGFYNEFTQVSYQADIEPLPQKASLLTFHPFIQFGDVINNLLVLNITKSPEIKKGLIKLFNSYDKSYVDEVEIQTNSLTTIPLDKYGFKPTDLPVFYSANISGIPFGLGIAKSGKMLSLEHTHPPASLVLFGNRRDVQGRIKKSWIDRLIS